MQSTQDPSPPATVVSSPRLANATALLRACTDAVPFTASQAMARTGLTRSTIIGLCNELIGYGWFQELPDARSAGAYQKGRPARRYVFDPDVARVVGIDAGQHRIAASLANLNGTVLHTDSVTFTDDEADAFTRRRATLDLLDRTVCDAPGRPGTPILSVVAGIPAPVDLNGHSPEGEGFWPLMNADLGTALAEPGRVVRIENDANLAAVAEHSVGAAVDTSSFATLLSGERFGAGLIVDGNLLHGDGGAGELRLLDLVAGVEGPEGLARMARDELTRHVARGRVPSASPLAVARHAGHEVEAVLAASRDGDAVATEVSGILADRLARVCAVVGTLLGLETVVVAGALAPTLGPIVADAQHRLEALLQPPVPRLHASPLGGDVVLTGALHQARQLVWEDPLRFDLQT